MRYFLIVLTCGFAVWPVAKSSATTDWTVAALMEMLAGVESRSLCFSETKYLAMLTEPLVSSGELRYLKPAFLEKRTLEPRTEIFIVHGDSLVIDRGEGRRRIDLKHAPPARAFVEVMRAIHAGDTASLQRQGHVSLIGSLIDWTLTFEPFVPDVADYIAKIVVRGHGADLAQFETLEGDGDRTVMTIQDCVG